VGSIPPPPPGVQVESGLTSGDRAVQEVSRLLSEPACDRSPGKLTERATGTHLVRRGCFAAGCHCVAIAARPRLDYARTEDAE